MREMTEQEDLVGMWREDCEDFALLDAQEYVQDEMKNDDDKKTSLERIAIILGWMHEWRNRNNSIQFAT